MVLCVKEWELNTQDLFLAAFQGTRLFLLMMQNFFTCFSLQLQIICLNEADLSPSHFCLHLKAGTQRLPTVVPGAWQSGGAAALPGTVSGAAVRDTETLWCAAHSWNVAVDGCTGFRKDRWRRAWGVMLYILDKCSAPVSNWRQTC